MTPRTPEPHPAASSVHVVGTGAALPDGVLPSAVLERRFGLAPGTVASALGVRARRVAPPQEATSDLAERAARAALAAAGEAPEAGRVALLLLATSTPDHVTPATAPLVAHRLGLRCPASDVANTCAGWIYALALAERWLRAEPPGTCALVVGANVLSRRVDWSGDWRTAALFGDGAGAVVLRRVEDGGAAVTDGGAEAGDHAVRRDGRGPAGGILSTALAADGAGYAKIQVTAGGSRTPLTPERFGRREHLLREAPKARLEESVAMLTEAAGRALAQAGLTAQDVALFVPHQASGALVRAAAAALGIPEARTVRTLEETGNTSAASIPIALDAAARAGRLRPGDHVLLATVAAGMTAGAAVVAWTAAPVEPDAQATPPASARQTTPGAAP